MTHLLKNLRSSHRSSIFRLVALAGTGVYCANNIHEDTSISVSISRQWLDQFTWTRQRIQDVCGIELISALPSGHNALQFSGVGSASLPSSSPDVSGKCGCGCLGRDSIANAAALVAPAVVNLCVNQVYRGIPLEKCASGTIIDSDGTILTCAHVLMDLQGSRSLSHGKVDVTLQDGRTFEGTVMNADFHSDIALLKITSKTPLPTARLGSSCRLRPGDWVVAMGCPLSLQNTITAGIVSCVDRKSSDLGIGGMRREYLQTDCAINAGNSGGPLVNLDGEIIGVNIMKMAVADGLGFSVPIDSVSKIIEQFKKNGRVVRPWLGMKMLDLNDTTITRLKERDASFSNATKGVLVPMVTPGSPAARAGFRSGDVVIQFGGKPVESIKEIIDIMGDGVGKQFEVVIKRDNDKLVTLIVVPEEANPDI